MFTFVGSIGTFRNKWVKLVENVIAKVFFSFFFHSSVDDWNYTVSCSSWTGSTFKQQLMLGAWKPLAFSFHLFDPKMLYLPFSEIISVWKTWNDFKIICCSSFRLSRVSGVIFGYKCLLVFLGLFLSYDSRNLRYRYVNDFRMICLASFSFTSIINKFFFYFHFSRKKSWNFWVGIELLIPFRQFFFLQDRSRSIAVLLCNWNTCRRSITWQFYHWLRALLLHF